MTYAPVEYARSLLRPLLTDTADVRHVTLVPNADGGMTQTEASTGTVACRLEAQTSSSSIGQERPEGGRVVAVTLWTCYLPAGTAVNPADVLVINSERFEIVDADEARTDSSVVAVSLRRVV